MSVFDEIAKNDIVDHYVLDTLVRTASRMTHKTEYMQRYQEVIESLQNNHPKDKELVKSVYEGSLRNNKFSQAAKMASKLTNNFSEQGYVLSQI